MTSTTFQPGEPYNYPLIIKKLLMSPITHAPDQEIVYRDSFRMTYRDLNRRVGKLASALSSMGALQGDSIAVFDYDSHRYLESFFAIPMMGAVLQMVNWRLSPAQILYTINHGEAKTIIINSDFLPILDNIKSRLLHVKQIIVIRENPGDDPGNAETYPEYEKLLETSPSDYIFPDLDENTTATTFYTTGTTGDPKGVHFSHRQLVLQTLTLAMTLGAMNTMGGFTAKDVYMPLTPMFHVHAWGLPYIATVLGAKQVYPGRYEPEMLLKLILREKVSFSHCVPTILQMLTESPAVKQLDLSRWKVVIGGARLPRNLASAAMKLGITLYSGYGMSETCPVISLALPKPQEAESLMEDDDRLLDIIVKSGLPIPLVELEVIDEKGNFLPHDGKSAGEIVFRAPWLTKDYVKNPEASKKLWKNGWLHSGDMGHIDETGYLCITDRIKDVIKTGGEWVSSLALEEIMGRCQGVSECAALGVTHEKWGERPVMAVTLNPGKASDEQALRDHMIKASEEGEISRYAVPDRVLILKTIPKTSVGKHDKKRLRDMF